MNRAIVFKICYGVTVWRPGDDTLSFSFDLDCPEMTGNDRYELAATREGTHLRHMKNTLCQGALRLLEPLMRRTRIPRLEERLVGIRNEIEARHVAWQMTASRT